MSYVLTGRASFNLANFGMFGLSGTNGNLVSGGLLELGLGSDGLGMRVGSAGMDASLGAVYQAASGLEAWGVNAMLLLSAQDEAKPSAAKGTYVRTVAVSSTMGPGFRIDPALYR